MAGKTLLKRHVVAAYRLALQRAGIATMTTDAFGRPTIDVSSNTAVVSPTPVRRDKLRVRALAHLTVGSLTPTDAGCLAGKATFFV